MIARRALRRLFTLGLLAGGLVSGCGPAPSSPAKSNGDIRRDAIVVATEQSLPSVVNIATTAINEYRDQYQDWVARQYGRRAPALRREERDVIGSGVIIDEAGYLITSYHVVSNATRVRVKLSSGEEYDARKCVGGPQKDIALLQIIAPEGRKFQAMKFANDDDLLLGETVIALGNPFGLGGSVTRGILSSKNRRPSAGDAQLDILDWLQTDADINPGNSGGPLINLRGELIGLNVAAGAGQGIGFAVPIKQVSGALSEFFTPEAANAVWFGAQVGSFNPPLTITSVQPRSPAEKAGLRVGQRVVTVNGQSPRSLVGFLQLTAGRTDLTTTLQVEVKGQSRSLTTQMISFQALFKQRLGLALRNLTLQDAFGVKPGDAVLIEQVENDGPASKVKLQPGFLLAAMDDLKSGTLLDAAKVISTKQAGDRVNLFFIVPHSFGAGAGEYNTTLTVR